MHACDCGFCVAAVTGLQASSSGDSPVLALLLSVSGKYFPYSQNSHYIARLNSSSEWYRFRNTVFHGRFWWTRVLKDGAVILFLSMLLLPFFLKAFSLCRWYGHSTFLRWGVPTRAKLEYFFFFHTGESMRGIWLDFVDIRTGFLAVFVVPVRALRLSRNNTALCFLSYFSVS